MRPASSFAGALALGLLVGSSAGAATPSLGERLFREGRTSSGQPVRATVEGDVPAMGPQLVCASCHARSGMGSVEGKRWVIPIAGPFLSIPRKLVSRPRPAYTPKTLIRAIREGIDSGGNRLDPMMPRYHLSDADARALVSYLTGLSAKPSPGVEGNAIHLATVIAPDVTKPEQEAMLGVLHAFFAAKSASARDMRHRHDAQWPEYFGDWKLHVWRLHGPPAGWAKQLAAFYRAQPVFAVVSGIGLAWEPVHRFCEARAIPCILPNVETPPSTPDGYYAMYFSEGTRLEAKVIASRLDGEKPKVLQVVSSGLDADEGARTLEEAVAARGGEVRTLRASKALSAETLAEATRSSGAEAVVLWLSPHSLAMLGEGSQAITPATLYVSSTLLGGDLAPTRSLRSQKGFVVHPYATEAEAKLRYRRVESWLASQKIPSSPAVRRIQGQTFFAATVLSEGFMHLKRNFLRDYLLEGIDHFSGVQNFSPDYPHLTFGPGQRALSKGCTLIPLSGHGRAQWVVP